MNSRLDMRPAAAAETTAAARALRIGSSLHGLDFEIVGVVHDGGFSVNYLARNRVSGQQVVIKEYLPSMLAWRTAGGTSVAPKAPRHDEAYKAGLRAFTNEARLLASFGHPAVVRVLRHWKENGTAYMAMPVLDGATLRRVITERGAPPDEAELRGWLNPILDGLDALHGANCVHGDITPDSMLLTRDGAVLLGFGGGRHAIAQALRAPGEALKAGYAAAEQYSPTPAPLLGPWTDLYGLGGVLCAVMTGRAPMAAPQRMQHDDLEAIAEQVGTRYTASLSDAVDAALAIPAIDRPQTVAAFRALLSGGDDAAGGARRRSAPSGDARIDRFTATMIAAALVCAASFTTIGVLLWRSPPAAATASAPPAATDVPIVAPVLLPIPDPMTPARSEAPATPKAPVARPMPPAAAPRVIVATTPAPSTAARPRDECSELTQRASLQTLTPAEAAQLKKECRK